MYIDVRRHRRVEIAMHGLNHADDEYTLYYDETNNHRLVRITDTGLNNEAKCFVLGGIGHRGPPRELNFPALRAALYLQPTNRDLKLRHLGSGDFLRLLGSVKVGTYLQWLEDEGFYLHLQAIDPIFWSIVDIIDSILTEAKDDRLNEMIWPLKDTLNTLVRADLQGIIDVFRRFDYPNVGATRRCQFLEMLLETMEPGRSHCPLFAFQMLKGVLQLGKQLDRLPFLEDEKPGELVAQYRDFYMARLSIMINAHHVLDAEDQVSREVTTWRFMDGDRQLDHFRFAVSHEEVGIQMSDPVVGLIGKLCDFIIVHSEAELAEARAELNDRQRSSLATLSRLLDRSLGESDIFANFVMAPSHQRRLWAFLDE